MINDISKLLDKYYQLRDKSHGKEHIHAVLKWTQILIETDDTLQDNDKKIIKISACLHDAYDHKYYNDNEISKIKVELRDDLKNMSYTNQEINDIFKIIEHISFSKEFKARSDGITMDLGSLQKNRDIVSDADKIEAVGISGIIRMIQFEETIIKEPKDIINQHIEHIRDLCQKRLYLLVSDNYIKTEVAKQIVSKKIEEMKEIIDDDTKLSLFIQRYIK